jgi:hypothetical protein
MNVLPEYFSRPVAAPGAIVLMVPARMQWLFPDGGEAACGDIARHAHPFAPLWHSCRQLLFITIDVVNNNIG